MKSCVFFCLLLIAQCYQVNQSDKCNTCNQLKSQMDCENGKQGLNLCEWISDSNMNNGKCQQKIDLQNPNMSYTSYCDLVIQKEINCRLTNGCAYINKKCIIFAGCSAYGYQRTFDCQAISYQCISDGKSCINIKECKDYTEDKCNVTPSLSGKKICKWDQIEKICKDYKCSESDDSLKTDEQCDQWLKGCITRGMGCWDSPLPPCSNYKGNEKSCNQYFGQDGYCEKGLDEMCQAKKCENASQEFNTDSDCQRYQKGCITNGKGCIFAQIRPLCSTYFGDSYTCQGYIGSDGQCEGDQAGTICRAKRCENSPNYTTDELCKEYQSNCITNGVGCVQNLQPCSSYKGNIKLCFAYKGSDGYCKGDEKDKDSHQQCMVRVCNEAPTNLYTDEECNAYQIGCVTTGFGCINKIDRKSCTSYLGDSQKCLRFVGIEGNCMWLSGHYCTSRECQLAPVNQMCNSWMQNCVSTGKGCIMKRECQQTINQLSCEGTEGCFWQSTCNDNSDCFQFKRESICRSTNAKKVINGILNTIKCTWTQDGCRQLNCYDLIGQQYKDDINCQNEISYCISDMKNSCITKYDCSKLYGNKQTCLDYLGYCINDEFADDNTPCILRQCKDNVELISNQECNNFLPGCVSNGRGCVEYGTECSQMQGDQNMCNQFFGYLSGSSLNFTTIQCYNHKFANSQAYCQIKTCNMAEDLENDNQCQEFLNGCFYNGNGGCIDPQQATCESYYGDELFCEQAIVGQNQKKYCFGTSNKGQCMKRECWHISRAQTNSECELFRQGCLLMNSKCVDQTSITCQDQSGTQETCSYYYGGIQINNQWNKIQCLKKVYCQERQCEDVQNPNNPQECTNYKSTCRFFQKGYPCIRANNCNNYQIPDSANTDQFKFDYCNSIKDQMGLYCGWNEGFFCSTRDCNQIQYGYSSNCSQFIQQGKTTGNGICKLAGSICYAPRSDCYYSIPINLINNQQKYNHCIQFQNDKGINCTYAINDSTCSSQDTCEKVINSQDAKTCNDFLGFNSLCQKGKNSNCYTTSSNCFDYQLPPLYTYTQKLDVCLSLKILDGSFLPTIGYKSCTYVDGQTCSNITQCQDIKNASSQKDCNEHLTGCLYFQNECYSQVASCNELLFPSGITSDSMKSLFCNSMKNNASSYCSLKYDKNGCEDSPYSDCNQIVSIPSFWDGQLTNVDQFCLAHTDKTKSIQCINDNGLQCKAGTCEDIPTPLDQNDCDNHINGCIFYFKKCRTSVDLITADNCSDTSKVPFPQDIIELSNNNKIQYCELFKNNVNNIKCTYDQFNGIQNNCTSVNAACTSYPIPNEIIDKQLFCQSKKNIFGFHCKYNETEEHCNDLNCSDAINPKSQLDCDTLVFQNKCKYLLGTCYHYENTCSQIPALKENSKIYCEKLVIQTKQCTYIGGDYCIEVNNCEQYNVESVTNKLAICNQLLDYSYQSCTYLWGNNCVNQRACEDYDGNIDNLKGPQQGFEDMQCYSVKSILNNRCVKDQYQSRKCRPQVCEDISDENNCLNDVLGCFYYNLKCLTKKECYQYSPIGYSQEQQQQWCEGVQSINGSYCRWNGTGCSNRNCSDVQYYTDFDCQNYLTNCKTDGMKCIEYSLSCNQMKAIKQLCGRLLDKNGKDKCKSDEPNDIFGKCDNRTCYDNINAQSDTECNEFMHGCVTKGYGCIPNTEPCTSYRGTKIECEQFKQLINNEYVYCSGYQSNQSISKCKVRSCSDNTTAISDQQCSQYLKGCITKGEGCIQESALCSEYQGNQAICQKFKGNNGQDHCFSTSISVIYTPCRKLECRDIQGVDNSSCNERFESITCVFDGLKCINYGMKCSEFKGNYITCSKFIAIDGPCKATLMDEIIISNCTTRVCNEAPNTLKTDQECQIYHPSCYTTGYGCTSIKQCDNLITQAACQEKQECSWTHFCNQQYKSCDSIKNASYSICFNSKIQNQTCAFTENTSQCRSQTCDDLPNYITSHNLCNQLNPKCTTNGMGCITFGQCSTYRTASICLYAQGVQKCIWDETEKGCRDIRCSDFNGRTDVECEQQMNGCITNGNTCIFGDSCDEYNNQNYCIQSKKGPCLWIQNSCINYSKCEDAKFKTFQECQLVSPFCTSNGLNCIPLTFCDQYQNLESCVFGLEKLCGWNEKCQPFKACSDLKSPDNNVCKLYHNDCVSDGQKCIQVVQKCSMYLTSQACINLSQEETCIWNQITKTCKSITCEDYQYKTHFECQQTKNQCTTNGTTCIPLQKCSNYGETSCYQGTDGLCIFSFPFEGKTPIKSCRPKECQDVYNAQNNQSCQNILPGKQCVSNGIHCIPKAQCSTYLTLTACQGGGIDGKKPTICAFIPKEINSQNGTCKTFSQCADADKDEFTCKSNPSCYWNINKCVDQTCETFSSGLNCNPIPSFDGTKYTICLFENGKCQTNDPKTISESKACFIKSAYTHTWNSITNQCEACFHSTTPQNPGSTNIDIILSVFVTAILIV
ncbi:unnamed protein product [Paramecium pentaurelia]|uniref:Uncharacterized protein n=1 Tax=Paramecium pentaurelia TaxID=43138 RepID=A0A8S1UC01_9CILI|nr:unnamed protein product [Paramecium pentaurelia]